ncbi:MAG TPA: alpha/beta hydrolase [Kofleriaceae bacterium]|jgi:pimeloyl-ACP methyl ester carboxylesterase
MPTINVRDIAINYEQSGAGPTIILVHGLGSSLRDWDHLVPALAEHYRVVSLDLRGHGQSSRKGPITITSFASDVLALADALEIDAFYIGGISMGTAVAFQLAVDAPSRVRGLVVINGGPEGLSPSNPQHVAELELRVGAIERHGMSAIGELLAPRLLPLPEHAEMRRVFVERWAQNDQAMYLASLRALVGWSVREELAVVDMPVCAIAADNDYTPVEHKRAYVNQLAHAELVVIPSSGHMTTHDQPAALVTAMRAFLDANLAPRGISP